MVESRIHMHFSNRIWIRCFARNCSRVMPKSLTDSAEYAEVVAHFWRIWEQLAPHVEEFPRTKQDLPPELARTIEGVAYFLVEQFRYQTRAEIRKMEERGYMFLDETTLVPDEVYAKAVAYFKQMGFDPNENGG